jgi:hypothetical protein
MAALMSADERLLHESRVRTRQAVIAGAGAVLFVVAAIVQLLGPQAKVSELTVQLIVINRRFPLDIISSVVQGAGLLALAATLAFLFDSSRVRRPQMAAPTRIIAISGAVVAAIASVAYAVALAIQAHHFVTHGSQTYQEANHLTGGTALPVLQTLDIAAQFALEIGLILIALNATRVGLLPRFLGYTGVVAGIAGMLLLGSAPAAAIQVIWLGALAYLFSGRWPGGDPPAWRTGRAEPWPNAADLRAQRMKAAGASPRGKRVPQPAPQPVAAPASTRGRAATPKRKRKRRR